MIMVIKDNHDFNYSDGEDISRQVVDYVVEKTKLDKSLVHNNGLNNVKNRAR